MTTSLQLINVKNQQIDEVLYFNPKCKERLINGLNDNSVFEHLMFNLWRIRGVLYNILEKDKFSNEVKEQWGEQFHAVNNLIGVLLEGNDWNQQLFTNNQPTAKHY